MLSKISVVVIMLLMSFIGTSYAQCSDWDNFMSYDMVYVSEVERDRFGNLYVVGWFNSPNFTIGTTHLTLYGDFSIFILKFDKNFSLQWGKSVGNNSLDLATSIEIDKDGNPVVAGYFYSTSIEFDCITLQKSSRSEMFLVKYSNNGNVIWAKGTAGLNDGFFTTLTITESNNIILSSSFVTGHVTFGGKSVQGVGGYDSFVASVRQDGEFNWLRSFGGVSGGEPDYIEGIDTDADDNIIITGFFESQTMAFDNIFIPRQTVTENFFVAKLSKEGNVLWAKGGQAPVDTGGKNVIVDTDGDIFVVGHFFGGDGKFGNISLVNQGEGDIFIVKYNSDGEVLDAKSFGGDHFDTAQQIDFDASGNIVIGGSFYSNNITFDSYNLSKVEFQSDAFVAILDSNFITECIRHVGGDSEAHVMSLNVDRADNVWVVVESIMGGQSDFEGLFTSSNASMIVSVGNNNSFDTPPVPNPIGSFSVTLGEDIHCFSNETKLDAGSFCSATYTWSDGSHNQILNVRSPGKFWVRVEWMGNIGSDTINITGKPLLDVDLGDDKQICMGNMTSFDATQKASVVYSWDDGSTLPVRTIQAPGWYWVKVRGECEVVATDSILIRSKPRLSLDLGKDTILCNASSFEIGSVKDGVQRYRWNDNTESATLIAMETGTYEQTIWSECESVRDQITITFVRPDEVFIPNVVTDDGNSKNDKFVLPAIFNESASLAIYNRWGQRVFSSNNYLNNWPQRDEPTGVYFYLLKGSCLGKEYKGNIHLMR